MQINTKLSEGIT